MELLSLAGITAAAYVIGSIPFAQIFVSLIRKGTDLCAEGTKEPGGYNALITAGPKAGIPTIILALLKSPAVMILAWYWPGLSFREDIMLILLLVTAVIAGQMFSVFNAFKGSDGYSAVIGAFIFL
ncbi:MAG: glycerol-3-phosphate acyltransferase, partial [Spirochaetota bacterium]